MSIFTDNADFYPTPREVIEQMMLGENILDKTDCLRERPEHPQTS